MKKRLSLFALLAMLTFTFAMPMTVFAAQVEAPPAEESTNTEATTDSDVDGTDEAETGSQTYAEQGISLGTGDAVNDILQDGRFAGAIESIAFITKFVDHWFTVIITATAFFIISAAMLRNVMAGAYCSNHKFWDKVAEAHEKADAVSIASIGQFISGKQFMNTTGGGFRDALLCIVPNIKAWTDFDDVDIEPKQYFMKAIPQMLACIIIGVFIYNGYYRDTAATVGDFGSEICNRVFESIDPAKVVDKVTLTTRTPDNIYKNDPTVEGQYRYAISSALYKVMVSTFNQYTDTNSKTALMRNCEHFAQELTTHFPDGTNILNADAEYEYKLSNVKVVLVPSTQNSVSGFVNNDIPEDSDGTRFMSYYKNWISTYGNVVGMDPSINDTVYVSGSFKKVSKQNTSDKIKTNINATTGASAIAAAATAVVDYDTPGTGKTDNVKMSQISGSIENAVKQACSAKGYNVEETWSFGNLGVGYKDFHFEKDQMKVSLGTYKIDCIDSSNKPVKISVTIIVQRTKG